MRMRRFLRGTSMTFEVMTDYLKSPDLMIYLRASIETLVQQISRRGRSFEQSIPREYLEQLNKHYESWIANYHRGPLLIIESDNLDFVNRDGDLEQIMRLVKGKLESIRA
jgi:deoxyadenosine/deoxycytidine kinase